MIEKIINDINILFIWLAKRCGTPIVQIVAYETDKT